MLDWLCSLRKSDVSDICVGSAESGRLPGRPALSEKGLPSWVTTAGREGGSEKAPEIWWENKWAIFVFFVSAFFSGKNGSICGLMLCGDRTVCSLAFPMPVHHLSTAIHGCDLEEAMSTITNKVSQEALGIAEQLGDLYCKVLSYNKALDAYNTQVRVCCFYSSL